jgi:transcriptional regulator with XRE-family HTH domain
MDFQKRKAIGQRIKKLREELGITQTTLATSVHKTSPAYIALIESGERNVSTMDLLLIAKQLGTSISELIGEAGIKEKPKFIEALRGSTDVSSADKKKLEEYYHLLKNQKNG